MSYAPYNNLQATNDFATFQFSSPTLPEATVRQMRFIGQQGGRIYNVDFRNRPTEKKDDASWPESKDFYCVVLTALLIIEAYSERYPHRILRFPGDTQLKAMVFGTILTRYLHLLKPLFTVETETLASSGAGGSERYRGLPGSPAGHENSYAFLIKRKSTPFFSIHTVESSWNGSSRIFNNDFSIELDKSIRIGLMMPNV